MVEDLYSDSVVTLGAMVIFASKAELFFFKTMSNLINRFFHHHRKIKEVSSGGLS